MIKINQTKEVFLTPEEIKKEILQKIKEYKSNMRLMCLVDPSYRKDFFDNLVSTTTGTRNEILKLLSDNISILVSDNNFKFEIRNILIQVNFEDKKLKYLSKYFSEINVFFEDILNILVKAKSTSNKNSLDRKEIQVKGCVEEILGSKNIDLLIIATKINETFGGRRFEN